MRLSHLFFACLLVIHPAFAQETTPIEYKTELNIHYIDPDITENTDYAQERCVLDIYYPSNRKDYSTVVWFHGGGITSGEKFIPEGLKNKGVAVVAVNYRLHPKVKAPTYIEDAASSVAWTLKNIEKYGGNPDKVFVSGHSAGGYLASMVGMDSTYLAKHQLDSKSIAGIISYSGHAITHFTIRQEMNLGWSDLLIDKYAPLTYISKDCPPLVLILADREKELFGRYEEVAYLWRMMQLVGHPYCKIYELDGYNHGSMAVPAHYILLESIKEILALE